MGEMDISGIDSGYYLKFISMREYTDEVRVKCGGTGGGGGGNRAQMLSGLISF